MNDAQKTAPSWRKRLGWFILIWLCSVAGLALAAYAMRLLMRMAGMSN